MCLIDEAGGEIPQDLKDLSVKHMWHEILKFKDRAKIQANVTEKTK